MHVYAHLCTDSTIGFLAIVNFLPVTRQRPHVANLVLNLVARAIELWSRIRPGKQSLKHTHTTH